MTEPLHNFALELDDPTMVYSDELVHRLADERLYHTASRWSIQAAFEELPQNMAPNQVEELGKAIEWVTLRDRSMTESPRANSVRALHYLGRSAMHHGDAQTFRSTTAVLKESFGIRGKVAAFFLKREIDKL